LDRLVVDSWAWVEYLRGSETGRRVDARFGSTEDLWTSVVSLTEVVSKYRRERIPEQPAIDAISSLSKFGVPSRDDAIEAGRIHAEVKPGSPNFGLADSFVLQLARKVGGKVLTGDSDFRGLREAEYIGKNWGRPRAATDRRESTS
jgi:predicted nucleic acid-binding protein